ncbi:hypothetical protein TNCV_2851421 [Trichonephila clavipes]|nr:hypothetical protein TNCV_2851421 [Trichonephila clavipes]
MRLNENYTFEGAADRCGQDLASFRCVSVYRMSPYRVPKSFSWGRKSGKISRTQLQLSEEWKVWRTQLQLSDSAIWLGSSPFLTQNILEVIRALPLLFPFHQPHDRTCGYLKVPPCRKVIHHLQTSMHSLGFKPRPNGTTVSVTNYYTGCCGVTENIRAPLQTQVLNPKPKYVLSVSQALGPLETLAPCNAALYVTLLTGWMVFA